MILGYQDVVRFLRNESLNCLNIKVICEILYQREIICFCVVRMDVCNIERFVNGKPVQMRHRSRGPK